MAPSSPHATVRPPSGRSHTLWHALWGGGWGATEHLTRSQCRAPTTQRQRLTPGTAHAARTRAPRPCQSLWRPCQTNRHCRHDGRQTCRLRVWGSAPPPVLLTGLGFRRANLRAGYPSICRRRVVGRWRCRWRGERQRPTVLVMRWVRR